MILVAARFSWRRRRDNAIRMILNIAGFESSIPGLNDGLRSDSAVERPTRYLELIQLGRLARYHRRLLAHVVADPSCRMACPREVFKLRGRMTAPSRHLARGTYGSY